MSLAFNDPPQSNAPRFDWRRCPITTAQVPVDAKYRAKALVHKPRSPGAEAWVYMGTTPPGRCLGWYKTVNQAKRAVEAFLQS